MTSIYLTKIFKSTVWLILPLTLSLGIFGQTTGSDWTLSTVAGFKTGYDSNVFLQDFGDQSKREAWVNTLTASFALTHQANPQLKTQITYATEGTVFVGESSENHIVHRGGINLSGKNENTQWEWRTGITRIDGDKLGPRFTLNGGTIAAQLPAIGGVPMRDRRDAAIFRSNFKLTRNYGQFFVRPVATFYHHNFMTEQNAPVGSFLGYENYVDRREMAAGLDLGFEAWKKTWLVAGFRAGKQKQYQLLGASSPYANQYTRLLLGIEGSPAQWLKLNFTAGPDFRDFKNATPAGFDRNKVYAYIDATAVITLSASDTLTVSLKRFMQPSYTSHSLYEDIVYDFAYRHVIDSRFTIAAGFKAYNAKWRPPVQRDEWVFTPRTTLSYTHNAHISAELSYSYDWVESKITNTTGREFTRHVMELGLKYTF